jgi:hypothetical protein
MVTTRSGKHALSARKPLRSRRTSAPKEKKKTQDQKLFPKSPDTATMAEIPPVNHNRDVAPRIIADPPNKSPTSPEPTITKPIVSHHDDAASQFVKTCGTENRPENPVSAVLASSKPDDHNNSGYASDDTCHTSNAAATHRRGILRNPVRPRRNKSFKVRFSTGTSMDTETASTNNTAPTFHVGTPQRTLVKPRRGTPHPKQSERSITGSIASAPRLKSVEKLSGKTTLNRSSSISTPKRLSSTPATSGSMTAKPWYHATATPPSKTFSAPTPRSTSFGVAAVGFKFGVHPATTPRHKMFAPELKTPPRRQSSTAETPIMTKTALFTSPRQVVPGKYEQRKALVAYASKVGQRIEARKPMIQAKKLLVCELMEQLEKARGDVNRLNADQQKDRGTAACCKSQISTLDAQIALESMTSPVSSKKRKSFGGFTKPIGFVSSSDDSSGNSGSDTDALSDAAVIHPSKKPCLSSSFKFDFGHHVGAIPRNNEVTL